MVAGGGGLQVAAVEFIAWHPRSELRMTFALACGSCTRRSVSLYTWESGKIFQRKCWRSEIVEFSCGKGPRKWRSANPEQERHCDVVEATDPGDRVDLQRLERAVPQ
jgi:hypothetical protein